MGSWFIIQWYHAAEGIAHVLRPNKTHRRRAFGVADTIECLCHVLGRSGVDWGGFIADEVRSEDGVLLASPGPALHVPCVAHGQGPAVVSRRPNVLVDVESAFGDADAKRRIARALGFSELWCFHDAPRESLVPVFYDLTQDPPARRERSSILPELDPACFNSAYRLIVYEIGGSSAFFARGARYHDPGERMARNAQRLQAITPAADEAATGQREKLST